MTVRSQFSTLIFSAMTLMLAGCGVASIDSGAPASTVSGDPSSSSNPSSSSESSSPGGSSDPTGSGTTSTGSGSTDTTPPADTGAPLDTGSATATSYTDFGAVGPSPVTTRTGTLRLPACALDYTEYLPDGDATAPLVVLQHGFQRSRRNMADLAEHAASHGLRVATPDACHSSIFDVDHALNGQEAAELAASLAAGGPTVHAGYSAGGLAAVLAASHDPDAVGVLGLDPVDNDGLAAAAAGSLGVPIVALFGEPNSCNERGSLAGPLDAAGAHLSGIPGAGHCDFESPTDGLCTLLCGGQTGVTPVVATFIAAFSSWRLGLDPSGEDWVIPGGVRHQELVDAGLLTVL